LFPNSLVFVFVAHICEEENKSIRKLRPPLDVSDRKRCAPLFKGIDLTFFDPCPQIPQIPKTVLCPPDSKTVLLCPPDSFGFILSIDPKHGGSQALDLKRLKKALADGGFDDKTIRALLEFAEEEEKVSVRLLKKRGEEE
jgi:hypothetical protein